jgi:hypothetical protein
MIREECPPYFLLTFGEFMSSTNGSFGVSIVPVASFVIGRVVADVPAPVGPVPGGSGGLIAAVAVVAAVSGAAWFGLRAIRRKRD